MKAKLNLAFDYRVRILTRTKSQSNINENDTMETDFATTQFAIYIESILLL